MNKLKQEIIKNIEDIEIIDSHEHLIKEELAVKNKRDLFSLFSSYIIEDLRRAGACEDDIKIIFNNHMPLDVRWKIFYKYWTEVKNTCFARSAILSINKFYGYNDINENNYNEISETLEKNYKLGIYKKVLRDTCHIKVALTQCFKTNVDSNKKDPLLIPIMPLWMGCGSFIGTWEEFQNGGPWSAIWETKDWKYGCLPIKTLDDCRKNQFEYFKKIKSEGAVGVKAITYPKMSLDLKPDRKKSPEDFQ